MEDGEKRIDYYPQIIGWETVNKIIEDDVMNIFDDFCSYDENIFEIDYMISLFTDNWVSVIYSGWYDSGAAHPNRFSHSINIDIKSRKVMKLGDYAIVGQVFLDTFIDAAIEGEMNYFDDMPHEPGLVVRIIEEYKEKYTVDYFENCVSSWFRTENGIGIIIWISHTSGDYHFVVGPNIVLPTGDINGDGQVNITDILLLRDFIFGTQTPKGAQLTAADLSGDDNINLSDILIIRDIIFGVH